MKWEIKFYEVKQDFILQDINNTVLPHPIGHSANNDVLRFDVHMFYIGYVYEVDSLG